MVEAALFGIAKSVLRVLASPALDEFRLLWGQKEQLEKLQDTVTTIRDVLQDADRRQAGDAAVQGWVTRLRVVLYEADDLFDMISAKVLHDKAVTGGCQIGKKVHLFLSKPRHFAFVVKTAHKVKAIRERLDEIARDIKGFGFLPVQTEQDQPYRFLQREQTHSFVPKNEVVGREKEREDIVNLLLPDQCYQEQNNGVPVVVVIGIGGLGKTTLAQLVYSDERVGEGFDLRMWACVNYFSHLTRVLVALLKSVTKSKVEELDHLDTLQSKFRREIEEKRFLLVLDDVWDEDPRNWFKLKVLLDCGKPGSMILATTRSEVVAQSLSAAKPYYHLQSMSDHAAWLLFKKIAFPKEEEPRGQDIEDLGRQIVKKCARVPLAIVTIASLLRNKEKKKWLPLVNDQLSEAVPMEYSKIMQILKISYNELPYPVKSCFAYCSLFPKHYPFEKQKLVRLWIAQGFVDSCTVSQILEDVAEEYFMYLAERCFFQDMKMEIRDGVTTYTCRMHDLVHDLAREVARLESALVDKTTHNSWDKTLHHVSLNSESESFVGHVCSFSHAKSLRTLLCLCPISLEKNTLNKLMSSFKVLRVLDLSKLKMKEIPASIGKLFHLRFIDLSGNPMKRLPSAICSLHHLQSLVLQRCWLLKELPKDLGRLLSLRHLVLEGCHTLSHIPPGLAHLTSLVTVDMLVVKNSGGGLRYLECLDNLSGSLKINLHTDGWKNLTMDAKKACLLRKSRLNALDITWKSGSGDKDLPEHDTVMNALEPCPNLEHLHVTGFCGREIPSWVMCLRNLVTLKLESCGRCVQLPPLSHLQYLKELSVGNMSSMITIEGSKLYDPELFFPSLKTLYIGDMPNLTSWWSQAVQVLSVLPTCPSITKLEIRRCPKLTACMPLFPLVEDVRLDHVQEEVMWQIIGSEATDRASYRNSALKVLRIKEIGDLRSIIAEDQIRHLSSLQRLSIEECSKHERVSCRGLAYLTSLEYLSFDGPPNLKWVDGDDQQMLLPPRLRSLTIPNVNRSQFKRFKYMTCLESLTINTFNEEDQELMQSVSPTTSEEEEEDGMPWKPLQKLRRMELEFGETFSMTSNQRLLKGIEYLTSLRDLTLRGCKEVYLSWRALLSLTHLEILLFEYVENVIDVDYSTSSMMPQLQLSSNLRGMKIIGGSSGWVRDIPWKSFPSLQALWLCYISELEALPEGIQHLTALHQLRIYDCNRVVSLPSWITSLSSLHNLIISGSHEELKKRCERLKGEDWPLIHHIPDINIQ